MTLSAGEWLALGIGLGSLATSVTALLWRVFRPRPPRRPPYDGENEGDW